MKQSYTIQIDTGGTFTDCYVVGPEKSVWSKSPTTTYDLNVAIEKAIEAAAEEFGIDRASLLADTAAIRYSTTLALNTLVQRKGPKLAYITTEGFEDTLLIGRASQWADGLPVKHQRNIARAAKPAPLIDKDMTVGVRERVDGRGRVVRPLDEQHFLSQLRYLVDQGARGFVVCLMWSFLNPVHEQRIRDIIESEYPENVLGNMPVYLSSEVSPRAHEYTRSTLTMLDAYLHQAMASQIFGLREGLRERGYSGPLYMIHNSGGMASLPRSSAVATFSGGPVAGLMGASLIGSEYGFSNVIATDMGGTSFDLGMIVEASTRFYQAQPVIDRWVVDATILDTKSIGAGGGSIARVNRVLGNRLEVGPESAGSDPGPVAYNQGGTEPTVTDADLVLGYLNPRFFHGGRLRLNARKARQAIEDKVAQPLGVSAEEAALLIKKLVDARMGTEIYHQTVLKGYDPREFILFALGGAGPVHACGYSREAQISQVVVFPFSAAFCAYGSSTMDLMHVYEKSHSLHLLTPMTGEALNDFDAFNDVVDGLIALAERDFVGEGHDRGAIRCTLELDMKFGGQLNVKRVSSPTLHLETGGDVSRVREAFEEEYAAAYSPLGLNPESGIVIENFILKAVIPFDNPIMERYPLAEKSAEAAKTGSRQAYWDQLGWAETPVYDENLLKPGTTMEGPALIERIDTTIVVDPGWRLKKDEYGNVLMTLKEGFHHGS